MEHLSSSLSGNNGPVREPAGQSLCLINQSPTVQVFLSVPGPAGRGHKCPTQSLAGRPALCIPSSPTNPLSRPENAGQGCRTYPHSPTLASAAVVCGPHLAVDRQTLAHPRRHDRTYPGDPPPPGPGVAPTNLLEVEWRLLTAASIPARVISTIQAARRPSMNRRYEVTWDAFSSWCRRREADPLSASVIQVLSFLQDGFETGLAPNTLRHQVAALASVLSCGSPDSLSTPIHPQFSARSD